MSPASESARATDRLDLARIVELARRCAALLRPVARHIGLLFGSYALLAIVFVPPVVLLFDLLWTHVLEGEPLPAWQSRLLGLDPLIYSQPEVLGAEARRALTRGVVALGGLSGVVLVPALGALQYYEIWILQRVNQVLRVRMLERLQSLSLRFHQGSKVGDAVYRLYQDSAMVTQLVSVMLIDPLGHAGRFLFCVAVIAAFDPWLALLFAALWPPVIGIALVYTRRMRLGFRAAREANSDLTSHIQEALAGIRVIKAYCAEEFEQERFVRASQRAFDAAYDSRNVFATFQVLVFWVLASGALTASALAALETRDASPIAATAVGFSAWNLGLYNFFKLRAGDGASAGRGLLKAWGRIQDVGIGLDRVFELLDQEPEVQEAPDAVPLERVQHGVAFRGVEFAWRPGRTALSGVDLEAPLGTITAVVGPTGSGKSTLMAMLLRLFDPDRGCVEIDGVDLRHLRIESLRDQVAIALQENVLFGDSVRENIRFAVPDASDEDVERAARVACADRFIRALPDGYDALLGERGSKLSTGQRQRISIARALLKDAPILILDEPTASLDAETELAVMKNLAEWGRGRVIFLVTHRLSTVRRADQIAVLHEGRLVESGSHEELLARADGLYRRLVEADSRSLEGPTSPLLDAIG